MSDLLLGWEAVTVGEVLDFKYGKSLPEPSRQVGNISVYGSNGPVGFHNESLTTGPTIVIGRKGSIGEVHYSSLPCFPIDTTYYIDEFYGLDGRFVEQLLRTLGLSELNRATAVPGLNREDAYAIPIAVPPVEEQRRIVAKLDRLLGRTTRARKELDRVPILVARYKQAILASAFSGRLTEDLRRSSNDEQWATNRTFGDLVTEGPTNGWSPPSSPDAQGALSLKLTATTSGVLRLDNAAVKRIHEVPPQNSKYWLSPGDLLIQRSNSIEHVGASAIFEGPAFTYIYPDLMMRVRFVDSTTTKYVWRYLNSEFARVYFRERATGTAGNMPKINGAVLRSLPVPLPSPSEMAEIVRRIDSAFEWLDKLAAEHAHASALLPKLEQALLAKAFRGELVPQDPNDEPASVLLERIRAERAAAPERKRKPRSKDLLGGLPVLRTTVQPAEYERGDRGNGRQGKLVPVAGR